MTKADLLTHKIAANALIAAIYFVLTMVSYPIAFGQIQFRIAEILVLLCFWRPDFIVGVTLGCFLANIGSSLGPWDMLIGTGATFLSCLLVSFASPRLAVATLWPILANAFIVAFELDWLIQAGFWPSVLFVGLGEATVILISYVLWMFLIRRPSFMAVLKPTRHQSVRW